MVQEVYIDLYFLINASMDLLCLMITAALLHRSVSRLRVCLAATLGGAYAVASLLLGPGGVWGVLLDLTLSLGMCATAFGIKRTRLWPLVRCAAVHLLVSAVMGGVMTALYTLLNRLHLPLETLEGDGLSTWTFALLTGVSGIVTLCGGRFLGFSRKTKCLTLTASLFGREVTLSAMVDSGNLLRDPVSGRAVIVADLARLKPILPPALFHAYESGDFSLWLSSHEQAKRIRPIPTRTASGEGLLFAMVPDRLTLTEGASSYPADYLLAAAVLGETAQGFDAVIPPA